MTSIRGKRVVVTGGAGFIGSHLVGRLLDRSPSHVTVIDDLSSGRLSNIAQYSGVEILEADIMNELCAEVVRESDFVFHLAVRNVRASIKDPVENMRVNSQGTLALLDWLRESDGGCFVYVSSSEIYGVPESPQFSESDLPNPTTVYGAGKLAGELLTNAYAQTYGMETRVVRPFNNYGPRSHFEGDSGEVIPKFILRALAGLPLLIHGQGTQSRDFMYVEETAEWLVRLAENRAMSGQTVNIGTGIETRIVDLAETVLKMTGSSSSIEFTGERPGDLPRLRANISRVSKLADFSLSIDLVDGLRRTIDYFAEFNPRELLQSEVVKTWT